MRLSSPFMVRRHLNDSIYSWIKTFPVDLPSCKCLACVSNALLCVAKVATNCDSDRFRVNGLNQDVWSSRMHFMFSHFIFFVRVERQQQRFMKMHVRMLTIILCKFFIYRSSGRRRYQFRFGETNATHQNKAIGNRHIINIYFLYGTWHRYVKRL